VAEFHKFQALSETLVEVNEKTCQLRSVEGEEELREQGKKTAEAIRQEIAREVNQLPEVVFQERRKIGRLDLEATEMAVRSALHRAGAAALSQLLQFPRRHLFVGSGVIEAGCKTVIASRFKEAVN
jgi:hypothetical protein